MVFDFILSHTKCVLSCHTKINHRQLMAIRMLKLDIRFKRLIINSINNNRLIVATTLLSANSLIVALFIFYWLSVALFYNQSKQGVPVWLACIDLLLKLALCGVIFYSKYSKTKLRASRKKSRAARANK